MDIWTVVHVVHLLAMAFFVGGQIMLAAVLVPVFRGREEMKIVARRFAVGSLIALGLLILTWRPARQPRGGLERQHAAREAHAPRDPHRPDRLPHALGLQALARSGDRHALHRRDGAGRRPRALSAGVRSGPLRRVTAPRTTRPPVAPGSGAAGGRCASAGVRVTCGAAWSVTRSGGGSGGLEGAPGRDLSPEMSAPHPEFLPRLDG